MVCFLNVIHKRTQTHTNTRILNLFVCFLDWLSFSFSWTAFTGRNFYICFVASDAFILSSTILGILIYQMYKMMVSKLPCINETKDEREKGKKEKWLLKDVDKEYNTSRKLKWFNQMENKWNSYSCYLHHFFSPHIHTRIWNDKAQTLHASPEMLQSERLSLLFVSCRENNFFSLIFFSFSVRARINKSKNKEEKETPGEAGNSVMIYLQWIQRKMTMRVIRLLLTFIIYLLTFKLSDTLKFNLKFS